MQHFFRVTSDAYVFCVCFSGLSPAAAELRYLKKAATLSMYGVDLHDVLVS